MIFVLVRNEIRFTGNQNYDSRAAWLRWAELVRALAEKKDGERFGHSLADVST
jgi:hypothetical protein